MTSGDPAALPAPFRWQDNHIAVALASRAHAVFTTRRGGRSVGPLASFDLGFVDPRHDKTVTAVHWRQLAVLIGISPNRLVRAEQVHGVEVTEITTIPSEPVSATDALVTLEVGLALSVVTADCLPIALANDRSVAIVHAGWRGLAAGIVGITAARMLAATGQPPSVAAIGPAIRRCCFAVGDDVRHAFAEYPDAQDEDTVDLAAIADAQLCAAGVRTVLDVGLCTMCSPAELFYSYRRDAGETGRQVGVVWQS